ncbi:MAG: hypothetical protein RLZZ574_1219, partial [Cyanobacteriota bacterium]
IISCNLKLALIILWFNLDPNLRIELINFHQRSHIAQG